MVLHPLDKAVEELEELEDISTRLEDSWQSIWDYNPIETKTRISTPSQWKEHDNWYVLSKDVNPEATSVKSRSSRIQAAEKILYGTILPPQQVIIVDYYDSSNMTGAAIKPASSSFTPIIYRRPLPNSDAGIFIRQTPSLLSDLTHRIEQLRLFSEGWNRYGNWLIIYSRKQAPEAAKLLTLTRGLDQLSVPYQVDNGVLPLLNESVLQAAHIVIGILTDRILRGLQIKHVSVEPLLDRDAGQWSEVVFTIQVDLDSYEANHEWDNILDKVSKVAHKETNKEVVISLLEKIGIHFVWIKADHVQS